MNHTAKRSRLTHARVAACVALGLARGVASAQATASSATGWRGDGSGRYPDAAPPLHWGRSSPAFDAVRWQADGPRGGAATGTSLADGVTRRWLVLGPVERPTTPEATAAADATAAAWQPAAGDTFGALAWKAADTEGALLALGDVFGAASNACAYACVYLNAPEAVTVALNLLHSSDVAIWLGGRRIHASNNGTTSCMVRLALQPGWNRLLVRTACGKGWFDKENWFLYAAFFPIEAPQAANLGWTLPYGGAAAPIVVGDRLLLQGETSDLLALDRDSGRTDWVRAVDYYHATPQAQRQAEGFAEAGRIAAEIDQLNASLSGVVGLTAEQQKVKEELLKRLYECMRAINPAAYTYTKEQDLGMAGFVPVSDGRHVWAWYASGIAACFDLEGNSRWMTLDNRAGQHHGFATSPLLADGKLIAYMHELLAFDAASGRQEWVQPLCPKPADQWSVAFQGSLCPLRIGGTDLFMTPNGTILRVSDGETLYANPALSGHFQAPTPVVEGRCVVKLNTDGTLFVLKLPETLAGDLRPELVGKVNIKNPAWRLFLFDWHMASPLLHEGLAYCLDTGGVLTVVDIAQVSIVYQKLLDLDMIDGLGLLRPSLCLAGGRIHALGSAGTMVVFEPGRTFRQLAKNRIAGVGAGYRPERFTATPVFDRDRIYVRGEHACYCIQAAGTSP